MGLPSLFLCRHGETDWNAEGRLQGQEDVPLNDCGRAQARRNGGLLKSVLGEEAHRYRFVSSTLWRARETMLLLREAMGLDPQAFTTDERLREVNFGAWQGRTLTEVAKTEAEDVRRREADKWNFTPPGAAAESYAALFERVIPVLAALDGPTIVVTHGGVLRSFLAWMGALPKSDAAALKIPQDRVLTRKEAELRWI